MSVEMSPGPEIDHPEHHATGHRWLDIILAVSAVFISLMSLFLAIQHGRVMEKMVEASTWAFVTVDFSNSDRNFQPHTHLTIRNKGVGPARIESLEVFYRGVAQPGPRALVSAVLGRPEPEGRHAFIRSDVHGVLSAKEDFDFLDFNVGGYSPEEYSKLALSGADLEFRVCYCSVLDECAVVDSRTHVRRPVVVKSCPVPHTPYDSQN
jgi:hypothetical protein